MGRMVEQDLIICRMLVELFKDQCICDSLIIRGGTALHKLFFDQALRYSEDIDLVQREPGPIGPVFDVIRATFRDWLGEPKRKIGPSVATLSYKAESEDAPPLPLRIKIEINTREHFQVLPVVRKTLDIRCRWFEGSAGIPVYQVEELLTTKLRALYQRRKGRDLFNLAAALRILDINAHQVVMVLEKYLEAGGHRITSSDFRGNVVDKLKHPDFTHDCVPLLRPGTKFDIQADSDIIDKMLISRIERRRLRSL